MRRSPLRRTTHLRSVGAKAKRLRAGWEASKQIVFARSRGRCEMPLCRKPGKDFHHIVKRSQGRNDSPLNVVYLCRADHDATDLPGGQRLGIETFQDGFGKTFALFTQWSDVSAPVALDPDPPTRNS